MAQPMHVAGFDGERGHGGGIDLGGRLEDAVGDGLAALVGLLLPQQAGQHRAAQLLLRRDPLSGRALVGPDAWDCGSGVQSHVGLPPNLRGST